MNTYENSFYVTPEVLHSPWRKTQRIERDVDFVNYSFISASLGFALIHHNAVNFLSVSMCLSRMSQKKPSAAVLFQQWPPWRF